MTEERKPLWMQFVEIAQPNADGFSRPIKVEDLVAINPGFQLGNGGSWCRRDGQLGMRYHLAFEKENGRIVSVKRDGLNDNPIHKAIREDIRRELRQLDCVVLATSEPQVDHKDGSYSDHRLRVLDTQEVEQFQPLSQPANAAKRQHCRDCLANQSRTQPRQRFDARRLGYCVGWTMGGANTDNCRGCYWYDPKAFNAAVSAGFKADDSDAE